MCIRDSLSTTPEDGYSYMTGTSLAAPMVTAAAAMVYSYYPDITLADVKEILLSSVQPLDTLRGLTATGGMLDLGAAMTYEMCIRDRPGAGPAAGGIQVQCDGDLKLPADL